MVFLLCWLYVIEIIVIRVYEVKLRRFVFGNVLGVGCRNWLFLWNVVMVSCCFY